MSHSTCLSQVKFVQIFQFGSISIYKKQYLNRFFVIYCIGYNLSVVGECLRERRERERERELSSIKKI